MKGLVQNSTASDTGDARPAFVLWRLYDGDLACRVYFDRDRAHEDQDLSEGWSLTETYVYGGGPCQSET